MTSTSSQQQENGSIPRVNARNQAWCLLTDGIELNALIAQVLRVSDDIILRFAISDQNANLPSAGSHPDVRFEVVLDDVVQSQTCHADSCQTSGEKSNLTTARCRKLSGLPVIVFPPL